MRDDMKSCELLIKDLADTDRLGCALAEALPDGTTVALCGTLGAGKTRLVQAIAAALGVPREHVVSPTFVLCQEYVGDRTIYHLDAYRLRDSEEFLQLGPEEYFQSPGLTLIEWADRVIECLPKDRLEVEIDVIDGAGPVAVGDRRRVVIRGYGARLEAAVERLPSLFGEPRP